MREPCQPFLQIEVMPIRLAVTPHLFYRHFDPIPVLLDRQRLSLTARQGRSGSAAFEVAVPCLSRSTGGKEAFADGTPCRMPRPPAPRCILDINTSLLPILSPNVNVDCHVLTSLNGCVGSRFAKLSAGP
jgi:hypothetical protein